MNRSKENQFHLNYEYVRTLNRMRISPIDNTIVEDIYAVWRELSETTFVDDAEHRYKQILEDMKHLHEYYRVYIPEHYSSLYDQLKDIATWSFGDNTFFCKAASQSIQTILLSKTFSSEELSYLFIVSQAYQSNYSWSDKYQGAVHLLNPIYTMLYTKSQVIEVIAWRLAEKIFNDIRVNLSVDRNKPVTPVRTYFSLERYEETLYSRKYFAVDPDKTWTFYENLRHEKYKHVFELKDYVLRLKFFDEEEIPLAELVEPRK